MLKRVKQCIQRIEDSEQTFQEFFIEYMKMVQDKNIDREVKNQIRFGVLQLNHLDKQIEYDYRKMVNDQNAKFN